MALPNFPSSPVNGATYTVNGVTFQYRVTAGRGEFVAQSGSASGTGGGIVYSNNLPTTLVPGVTYFDPEATELVFSYQDANSTQYLAFPLLAGSGSLNFVPGGGGTGGATTTLSNAGTAADGAALVQSLVIADYPIRRIKAAVSGNVVVSESGDSVVIDTLTAVNAGSIGFGLVNTKTSTTQPFKRIAAGTNVTVTDNGTHLTISSTGGGPGALGDTLTRLQSITSPENNNVPVFTAAGASQFLTTASTRAMMGLSTVGNTFPLFTGTSTATLAVLTPFMLTLLEKTGVPTALAHLKITSGSNANGSWLRVGTGDTAGIQICWHQIVVNGATTAVGSSFISANSSWTFPQPFTGGLTPSVSGTIIDGIIASVTGGSSGVSNTTATLRQLAPATTANAAAAVIAIGFY